MLHIRLYTIIFIIASIVNFITVLMVWNKRNFPGKTWFILSISAVIEWNLFGAFDISSMDLLTRIFWSKLEYFGATSVTPFLLLFFLNYPSSRLRLSKSSILLILAIPIFVCFMAMTNEWHHLVWTAFIPISQGTPDYIFQHGPIYWLALGYSYFCGTIIILQLFKLLINYNSLYRIQSITLLFFGIFPYLFGLIYSFGFNPFPDLDLLPLGFSISLLGVSGSILFLHLFDLVPIGRNLLVESFQEGWIMVNPAGKIADINPTAHKLLDPYVLKVGNYLDALPDPNIKKCFINPPCNREIFIKGHNVDWVEVNTTPIFDPLMNQIGVLGTIRDISENKRTEHTIRLMIENDSANTERQRIQRDLHDLVTQNLYSLQLFAQSGCDFAEQNAWPQAKDSYHEVLHLSTQVLKDMRLLLFQLNPSKMEQEDLLDIIQTRLKLVEQRANIQTKLEMDRPLHLSNNVQKSLYAVVTEALNNSLKYSSATRVEVKIKQEKFFIDFEIMDNGCGFDVHNKTNQGMGLGNMKKRIENLQGELEINSIQGSGTRVHFTVPHYSLLDPIVGEKI